jgi:3-polyprenyl-4-hydroxybenzoate decarboxylase
METLAARVADVTLKEGRRLMLVVRDTPLNDKHLESILSLWRAGAIIFPPVLGRFDQLEHMKNAGLDGYSCR